MVLQLGKSGHVVRSVSLSFLSTLNGVFLFTAETLTILILIGMVWFSLGFKKYYMEGYHYLCVSVVVTEFCGCFHAGIDVFISQ